MPTELLFPTRRPFSFAASSDDTWDFSVNNRVQLPRQAELQLSYIFNDFAIQRETQGQGFTALYENFLESQVATLGLKWRF